MAPVARDNPNYSSTELENVERVHQEHPRTFSIPRSDQRYNLRRGQLVKLIFLVDTPVEDQPRAERMWVEVKEISGNHYVGILENEPRYITNLKVGDGIEFGPEHVAALYHSSEDHHFPVGKTVQVSRTIITEEAWPQRLIRRSPVDENSSGWWILGEGETDNWSDTANFITQPVDDLLRQFRMLDSVLAEPVGTAWRWHKEALEYRPDQE